MADLRRHVVQVPARAAAVVLRSPAGRPPGHARHQRRRRDPRAVRLRRAERDRRSDPPGRHRDLDARARLAAVADRLRRGAAVALVVLALRPRLARGLPRHPRQDRAHERDHERAGHRHERRPGVRPPGRRRARVRRDQPSATATPTSRSIKYEAMQDAAIETVAAVCMASIIVALGYHPASFGTVVAFIAYLEQFFEPIARWPSATRCCRARWPAPSACSACSTWTSATAPDKPAAKPPAIRRWRSSSTT